jgi:hypothetical protein
MKNLKLHKNQSGIVSFFVVFIIMMVLTLIVLSFAKLVRREQRQTLDRQLNTQAFYAAETAVNDAINELRNNPALFNNDYSNDCDAFVIAANLTGARVLDSTTGGVISYSCLLVDTSPPELNYSSVPTNESIVIPIRPPVGQTITSLEISWSDAAGGTDLVSCPAAGAYPGTWPSNCDVGMLRLELLPFAGATPRNGLLRNRMVTYLQPSGATAQVNFNESADNSTLSPFYRTGSRYAATCNVAALPRQCGATITGLNLTNGYLRFKAIYRAAAVTIRAYNGATRVDLLGAQAEIDATGRANDVLRRIKVNAPIGTDGLPTPEFTLQSTLSQCKRFEIAPPSYLGIVWFGGTSANNPCNPGQTINQ